MTAEGSRVEPQQGREATSVSTREGAVGSQPDVECPRARFSNFCGIGMIWNPSSQGIFGDLRRDAASAGPEARAWLLVTAQRCPAVWLHLSVS